MTGRSCILLTLGAVLTAHAACVHAQLLTGAAPGATIAPPAAAAINPCALGVNFFPSTVDNKPTGWTAAAQQGAGNTASDQLVTIALAGYPIPQLYLAPLSVFTQVGGTVPAACIGAAADGVLVTPAHFTITWQLGSTGGKLGPYIKGSKEDPPANITLDQVSDLPDAEYCLQMRIDLVPGTGVAVAGTTEVKVPAAAQSLVRQACFYKLAGRPTANVTFHSCNSSFAVDLSDISPKPTFARYPDLQLWSTVFHIWGKLNLTFDRQPQDESLLDYFDEYVKWEDPTQPNFLQVLKDPPGLVNGYYNIWIEGMVSTSFPDLVSLFGYDQLNDGSSKYMGVILRNSSNRPVPIQIVPSKIAGLVGPEIPTPGEPMAFTWRTNGYGEQFCYVDGQKVANHADKLHCESPLQLQIADAKNHTLQVKLADVCGEQVANGLLFGSWGWRPDPKYAEPVPAQPAATIYNDTFTPATPLRPVTTRNRTVNAASTAKGGSVLGLLAAGLLTLVLEM